MKKIFLCLMTALTFLIFLPLPAHANAEESKVFYAKVENTSVNFCSSPSESSALFEIPYSYFVKVEGVVDDFFKVTYKDLSGYVRKDKVALMDGDPITPYANASYKVYLQNSLYETASNGTIIAPLDDSMTINYYGKKVGQQWKPGNNEWIYSSVQSDGKIYYGYVYSDHLATQVNISVNNEVFDRVSESVLYPSANSTFMGLSVGTKIILIVAISIPSILILYFLIKPSKIMQITKTKRKPKKEFKRVRHGDYFEFDENEL